jgi:Uma2 family endonuclease
MSTAALVPIEEYLLQTGKPYCEYREGLIYPKPMPTWFHGVIQFTLAAMLQKLGLYASVEVRLRLSAEKYLIPDVIAARQIQNPYPTEPVLLCCEILSPEDRLGALLSKCEEYHAWGVPFCWVIDPVKRSAWQYHRAAEPERVPATLRAGEFSIDLKELFSALDSTH